jgi:hypothetical protein
LPLAGITEDESEATLPPFIPRTPLFPVVNPRFLAKTTSIPGRFQKTASGSLAAQLGALT